MSAPPGGDPSAGGQAPAGGFDPNAQQAAYGQQYGGYGAQPQYGGGYGQQPQYGGYPQQGGYQQPYGGGYPQQGGYGGQYGGGGGYGAPPGQYGGGGYGGPPGGFGGDGMGMRPRQAYGQTYGMIDPNTGHDYRRLEDGGAPVDLDRVNAMLKRRLQCKMSRNFAEADQLRDELQGMGIMVHDREKTWECKRPYGGGMGAMGGGGGLPMGFQQPPPMPPAGQYGAPGASGAPPPGPGAPPPPGQYGAPPGAPPPGGPPQQYGGAMPGYGGGAAGTPPSGPPGPAPTADAPPPQDLSEKLRNFEGGSW